MAAITAMVVKLFPRTDNSPFLSAHEVARRIQLRYPDSVVDWKSADDKLQSELAHLLRLDAPQPIVQGHKNLFGKVVSIEVHGTLKTNNGFRFYAYPDSALELQSIQTAGNRGSAEMRTLALEIANCLDYKAEFID